MKYVILFCCFLALPAVLSAQWEPTFGPFGGSTGKIHSNDEFLFTSGGPGIFRSSNNGGSWDLLTNGLPQYTSLYPLVVRDSFLLGQTAEIDRRLVRSEDNGESWDELDFPDSLGQLFRLGITGQALAATAGGKLYLSDDAGETWAYSSLNDSVIVIDEIYSMDGVLFIPAYDAIYRSDTPAMNWTKIELPQTFSSYRFFAEGDLILVFPSNTNFLLRSVNGGNSWNTHPFSWGNISAEPMRHNGDLFAGGSVDRILRSQDDGQTWSEISVIEGHSAYGSNFVSSDGYLLMGGYAGIWRSGDDGLNWSEKNTGYWNAFPVALFQEEDTLWTSRFRNGLYRYALPSASWDTLNFTPWPWDSHFGIVKQDAAFLLTSSYYDYLLRSLDYGQTWDTLYLEGYFPIVQVDRFYKIDSTIFAYGVGYDGNLFPGDCFRTNDFGETWEDIGASLLDQTGKYPSGIAFRNDTLFAFSSSFDKFFMSANLGDSWVDLSQSAPSSSIGSGNLKFTNLFASDSYLMGSFRYSIGPVSLFPHFISPDGGNYWYPANGLPVTASDNTLDFFVEMGGALITHVDDIGTYVSLNEGHNWFFLDRISGLGAPALVIGDTLYAGIYGKGLWKRTLESLKTEEVTGRFFFDDNQNNQQDPGESGAPLGLAWLKGQPIYASADTLGNYQINWINQGPDSIKAVYLHPYATVEPQGYPVSGSDSLKNFAVYLPPNIDDLVLFMSGYGKFKPGYSCHYGLTLHNWGTTVMNGTLTVEYDTLLSLVSSDPPFNSQSNGLITWAFGGLAPLEKLNFQLTFDVPDTLSLGTIISATGVAGPVSTDQTPANNTVTVERVVTGSFDPNDKLVSSSQMSLEELEKRDSLVYTIRFQNTGTAPAEFVRILDHLDSTLDVTTFRPLSASHPFSFSLFGDGIVEFFFSDIQLPDSASNEPASHGYIQYSIKPGAAGLAVGDTIRNQAMIYFDYNAPIYTNIAKTAIDQVLSYFSPKSISHPLKIAPNPGRRHFTLEGAWPLGAPAVLRISDLLGRCIWERSTVSSNPLSFHPGDLPAGIYLVSLEVKGVIWVGKLAVRP